MLNGKIDNTFKMLRLLSKTFRHFVWELGFSGGKDSIALLHLLTVFVKHSIKAGYPLPKSIFVIYGDTLLDIPHLREIALEVLRNIEVYSQEELGGIIKPKILTPLENQDFFSMMIDKGYPPPHHKFRWCVSRLKINPVISFLSQFNGNLVMLTGERADESVSRSRIMNNRICGELGVLQRDKNGNIIATPLKDWTKDDVFAFLASSKQPWNDQDYSYILDAYGTDELRARCACGLSPNVRYGCWVCTVIKRDKALEHLSRKGDREAKVLLAAKEAIRKIGLMPQFREKKPNGKYGKLNQQGVLAVIGILAFVLARAERGLSGYLKNPILRKKIRKWLEVYYSNLHVTNSSLEQVLSIIPVESD